MTEKVGLYRLFIPSRYLGAGKIPLSYAPILSWRLNQVKEFAPDRIKWYECIEQFLIFIPMKDKVLHQAIGN